MNVIERKLVSQLTELREKYCLIGVKTEFEAEGALMEDMIRLREITLRAGVHLVLKVGGCEAVTDIRNGYILGVDELVVPVTESPFAVQKFVSAVKRVYTEAEMDDVKVLINVETIDGVQNFEKMLALPEFKNINGVAVGRNDMADSYGVSEVVDEKIFEACTFLSQKLKALYPDKLLVIGGGFSAKTINFLKRFAPGAIDGCESKKVIYDLGILSKGIAEEAFQKGIEFQKVWYESRLGYYERIVKENKHAFDEQVKALQSWK